MFFKAVNEYWILYAMIATASVGIAGRLCLNGIYGGLLRDLKRAGAPKRKIIRQMKKDYESCCQEKEAVRDMDSFIIASLYNQRFLGLSFDGWRRLTGQALFLCIVMGGSVALAGGYYGIRRPVLELYTVMGLVLTAGLLDVIWLGNTGRKQALLEAAALNYLNNQLPAEAWTKSRQEAKEALITELRDKKAEKNPAVERDIQYLAQSLEQIASEREKEGMSTPYRLSPAEGKLVEEIIEGFLG